MAESAVHIDLIEGILQNVTSCLAGDLVVFTDRPGERRDRRSPRINGFIPDVYVAELRGHSKFIGEAKAYKDFFSPHTTSQLRAFLDFLSLQKAGVLMLAVPLGLLPAAKCLLWRIAAEAPSGNVRLMCCSASVLVEA